jgi:hypothetical protein
MKTEAMRKKKECGRIKEQKKVLITNLINPLNKLLKITIIGLLVGCSINNTIDNHEKKDKVKEDSIIKQDIREAVRQGNYEYKVNNSSSKNISIEGCFSEYLECIESEVVLDIIKNKFGVNDSLKYRIRELGDHQSVNFIKIKDPLVVFGTNSSKTIVFSIYSPETLTESYVSENYHFGACFDFAELDSTIVEGLKDRYKLEFADFLIDQCK